MKLAETIYQHSCRLSEQSARETLDFVEFLELRHSALTKTINAQADTEAFIAAVAGTLSDNFPDDINDYDIGIDVQREQLNLLHAI